MRQLVRAGWLLALGCAITVATTACGPTSDDEVAVTIAINEVMASNQGSYVDEAGEYDDWIELFNPGDRAVDLEGLYISDDPEDPFKKRLPAGLQIEPGATLVLWADSDVDQGPNHLPFKLSAAGETVVVSDEAGTAIDSIEFSSAATDQVFGRYPDAKGAMILCATPTPNLKNGAVCGAQ